MEKEHNPLNDPETFLREFERAELGEAKGIDPELLRVLESVRIDPTEVIPPPPLCLSLGSDPYNRSIIATLSNCSLIIGKAKSKKTFFISIALAAATGGADVLGRFRGHLPSNRRTVLFFDTEQSRYHVQKVVRRVCSMAGHDCPTNFKAYGLRKFTPAERLRLIEAAIASEQEVGLVVIDGARDLVTSINDEDQATELSSHFMRWTEEGGMHLMAVLHQNKGDNNARGHLGAELVNKSETVLSVTKDEGGEFSIVEAEYCRDKEPEPFAFTIDENGLPELVEDWQLTADRYQTQKGIAPTDVPRETHLKILGEVFEAIPCPKYSELWRQLKTSLAVLGIKIGDNKAKDFAQYYLTEGYITREGKEGSPKATYQFNTPKNEQYPF